MNSYDTYKSRKVLITGHTGFKGSWLSLWLRELGAEVYGYALEPPTNPSLFDFLELENEIDHEIGDIRDFEQLKKSVQRVEPDIIFHLAAQSIVGKSYEEPLETIQVNTLGTVNLLEAVRQVGNPVTIVFITSDKCYENREWVFGYRETDLLGGYDPYSASKATAELLINSWRNSFFHPARAKEHGVRVSSARAGNVIGGGDWSKNRIVPDCIRDLQKQSFITVRNPNSTRPWQHVLEPLSGYLLLGANLLTSSDEDAVALCEAFNFGPHVTNNKNVKALVEAIINRWGAGTWKAIPQSNANHEASLLHLSIDKSYQKLGWLPKWDFEETIARTVAWYQASLSDPTTIREFTLNQIRAYQEHGAISPRRKLTQEPISNF